MNTEACTAISTVDPPPHTHPTKKWYQFQEDRGLKIKKSIDGNNTYCCFGRERGGEKRPGEGVKGKGGISAKALPSNGVQPLGLKQALFCWTATCFSCCFDRLKMFNSGT